MASATAMLARAGRRPRGCRSEASPALALPPAVASKKGLEPERLPNRRLQDRRGSVEVHLPHRRPRRRRHHQRRRTIAGVSGARLRGGAAAAEQHPAGSDHFIAALTGEAIGFPFSTMYVTSTLVGP